MGEGGNTCSFVLFYFMLHTMLYPRQCIVTMPTDRNDVTEGTGGKTLNPTNQLNVQATVIIIVICCVYFFSGHISLPCRLTGMTSQKEAADKTFYLANQLNVYAMVRSRRDE